MDKRVVRLLCTALCLPLRRGMLVRFGGLAALLHYQGAENGRRMTAALSTRLPLPGQQAPVCEDNDAAAKGLVQEGIARFALGSDTVVELLCLVVLGLVRRNRSRCRLKTRRRYLMYCASCCHAWTISR